jgi:uncharacterized protein (DUF1697 family)
MADLRGLLEALGCEEVATVLQSGNALFTAAGPPAKLEARIGARITADFGMDVKVLVRSAEELAAVVDANPWPARGADPKEQHFAFLSAAAPVKKIAAISADDFLPDEFEVGDRVLYLRLPDGVAKSRFPNWDRLLGVDVTARNWNTVNRLMTLAGV